MGKGLPKKYAKMGFKKGWKAYKASKRKRKSNPSSTRKKNKKRRKTTVAKRRRSRNKSLTVPLAVITPLAANIADAWVTGGRNWEGLLDQLSQRFAGYSPKYGWQPQRFARGMGSLVLGAFIHKYVGGPPLNLNRVLAAAGVPFIRI